MLSKVGDGITHQFSNLFDATVEVREWISNFTLHLMMDVITPMLKLQLNYVKP